MKFKACLFLKMKKLPLENQAVCHGCSQLLKHNICLVKIFQKAQTAILNKMENDKMHTSRQKYILTRKGIFKTSFNYNIKNQKFATLWAPTDRRPCPVRTHPSNALTSEHADFQRNILICICFHRIILNLAFLVVHFCGSSFRQFHSAKWSKILL